MPEISDYLIGKQIGRGRFGHVFRVQRKADQTVCACKVLFKKELIENNVLAQLMKEIEIQYKVSHKYCLKLREVIQDHKRVFLICDLADHGNLYSYLKRLKRFPCHIAGKYTRQLLSALVYLHSKNIIHRDIKPENLLLCSAGNLLLCDFGWSTRISDTEARMTLCGTPDYLPPEMLSHEEYTSAVDSWCVGVLLYEFLTGRAPFTGSSNADTFSRIRRGEYSIPEDLISDGARSFINCSLRVDPDKRYSAGELYLHLYTQEQDEEAQSIVEHERLLLASVPAAKDRGDRQSIDSLLGDEENKCENS